MTLLDTGRADDRYQGQSALQDMDPYRGKQALELDWEKLSRIWMLLRLVTPDKDQKLHRCQGTDAPEDRTSYQPGNRKIIIFTAFADTAKYLYDQIAEPLKAQGIYAALVTGAGVRTKAPCPFPNSIAGRCASVI